MVIQSLSGAVRIALSDDSINITASAGVNVKTPITTIDQQLIVNGKATFNGGIEGKEGTTATLPTGTTVGGIDVSTHGHIGNGPGNRTGNMIE